MATGQPCNKLCRTLRHCKGENEEVRMYSEEDHARAKVEQDRLQREV